MSEASPSIFISYASQDRAAARSLRDALSEVGFEVWYDENELGGGDAWDQKIRRQIRECTYFMPVVSSQTEARLEGYFRREWRLAVERTQDMADDVTFLVPVVIDAVPQKSARVPERFQTVQWLMLPGGRPSPAFTAWAQRLFNGKVQPVAAERGRRGGPPPLKPVQLRFEYPPYPVQQPGKALEFIFHVFCWAPRMAWIWYRNLPKGWRRLVVTVLVVLLLERMCSQHPSRPADRAADSASVKTALDIAAQVASQFGDDNHQAPALLVYPFVGPAEDSAALHQTNRIFAAVYKRCVLALPGKVGLAPTALVADPLQLARERGAAKMLTAEVQGDPGDRTLEIKLTAVGTGETLFMNHYALAGADPDVVAAEVAKQLRGQVE